MWGTMMGGIKFIISAQVDHAVKEEAGWKSNYAITDIGWRAKDRCISEQTAESDLPVQ